jgi:hypothetical protein
MPTQRTFCNHNACYAGQTGSLEKTAIFSAFCLRGCGFHQSMCCSELYFSTCKCMYDIEFYMVEFTKERYILICRNACVHIEITER